MQLPQPIQVTSQVAQSWNIRCRHQVKLVATSGRDQVQFVQSGLAVDQNEVVDTSHKAYRPPQGVSVDRDFFAQQVGGGKHIDAAEMTGDISIQSDQIQPAYFMQEFVE